ncbi:PAS domain-containing protein [Gluconacetobacter sacchari DSM 12717]|uniref:histidine kinase n=2 Tax=Gluconacetobacter sacchari TaxID=92759 RepID=A0A7W4IAB4_9PROT|nr:ATP-binding protein [Gluconacetobacter sacchari]MBB2159196.1 response regulator [Gluconacetobacter sacchari]GBQ22160.1 PAS domain-containing protein [Gluconacetobacter sacchari DSM 12717]
MCDLAVNAIAFGVLNAEGIIAYCSSSFVHVVAAAQGTPVAGGSITHWLEPESGPLSSPWFSSNAAIEGTLRLKRRNKIIRYRLEPITSFTRETEGGAILFLGDDTLTLNLIHAQAFQLNPGLSAISVLETGEHLDVNPAWLNAMEYQRGDVIGRTAQDMNIWENTSFRSEVVRQLTKYGHVDNLQGRMRTQSGNLRDIIVSAKRVSYFGRILAVFASHDITEVKKSHADLEALNRQLESRVAERTAELETKNTQLLDAARLAQAANDAKSRFLATMSHEIRTPLNAIINMAELLLEIKSNDLDKKYLVNIVNSAHSLASIVDDTLDFAKIEENELKIVPIEVNVEAIVEEVVRSLAPLGHRKGIEFVLTHAPRLPESIRIDPTRLRQILYNLIGNSIKFTRSGWIEINVDLVVTNDEHELLLSIQDTGIGIAPADQNRIFDRFSKLSPGSDDATSGTGLGLSIAQGLAQAMGGRITVDSTRNHGSTFSVALPVRSCSAPPSGMTVSEVIILGPESRTRSALEAACAGLGIASRVAGRETALSGSPSRTAALVVLPLSVSPPSAIELYQRARSLCSRVIVFSPIGQTIDTLPSVLFENSQLEFYPIGRSSLRAALSEQDSTTQTAEVQQIAPSLSGTRILVADDVEENRLVIEWGLRACGAHITTTDNGEDAIRLMQQDVFDLLLLDLRMPGLDGYQTAARLRSLGGRIGGTPIIAVSANATPDASKMEAAGIKDFLAKPFRPSHLRSMVLDVLGRSSRGRQVDIVQNRRPILDAAFLTAQMNYAGPEAICRAIDVFCGQLEQRLEKIEMSRNDTDRIEAIHRLGGAASSLGLSELFNLCVQLEATFMHHSPVTRAEKIAAIRMIGESSIFYLKRYQNDLFF